MWKDVNKIFVNRFLHVFDASFAYICRWLQRPSCIAFAHCPTCDKPRFRSFSSTVVLSSSQQSPAIPKRFSATSFSDVRWHSFLNAHAAQSQNILMCSSIDSFQRCGNSCLNAVPVLRLLHTTAVGQREPGEPESKVEETLEALKDKKTAATEPTDAVVTEAKIPPKVTEVDLPPPVVEDVIVPEKKKSLWIRFKAELVHYYHGFRLLFIDTRVAVRLIWQVLNGRTLIRRERKQVSFMCTELTANVRLSVVYCAIQCRCHI